MTSHLRLLVVASAVLLAACGKNPEPAGGTPAEAPAKQEAPATPPAKEEVAAPAEAPAEEPKPQAAAKDTETVTNEACLAAVSKETGESDVSVLSNEFSEANTVVMVGVGADRAPWKCLVSNDGKIQEITFTGDDGAGAPHPAAEDQPAASSSDVSQAAIDACLKAVKDQTNEFDQAVLSSEFSEANSIVMIGVAPTGAVEMPGLQRWPGPGSLFRG